MAVAPPSLYLRLQGAVRGPFTVEQLGELPRIAVGPAGTVGVEAPYS